MSLSSRKEFHIHLRHDYCQIMSGSITSKQMNALVTDMEELGYNCAIKREEEGEEKWQLLIGLNDQEMILKEAEKQNIMCKRVYLNPEKREKAN